MMSTEALAVVEFLAVAIDHDGVREERREASELAVDQPEAMHHVFDVLVRGRLRSRMCFSIVRCSR